MFGKDLLRFLRGTEPRWPAPSLLTELVGSRVRLRFPHPTDWHAWRTVRSNSHAFLQPWEPVWPSYALHASHFYACLRRQKREWRQGGAYIFYIFHRRDNALVGGLTLRDVRRGIDQKAELGYWIGAPYAEQGLMTEAATLACAFAFETLRLHRVEACCLPHNEPSIRLLTRLGFTQEGFAKNYKHINGQWQDHLLWGKNGEKQR